MGLNIKTLDFLADKFEVTGKRICMLGNLYMARGTKQICRHLGTNLASVYFKDLGAEEVVMIDLNGKDGALSLDLQKPLPESLGQFDIIINAGTSEHVAKQNECFQNVHDICKVDGLMFHMVPYVGSWPNHGLYYYDEAFFQELANKYHYSIVDMYIDSYVGFKNKLIFVCFRKEHDG